MFLSHTFYYPNKSYSKNFVIVLDKILEISRTFKTFENIFNTKKAFQFDLA